MAKLSDAVRRTMKTLDVNADGLARKAGLARSTIFNVLADKGTDLETLRKLRKVGVRIPPIDDLLGEETRAA